MTSTDIWTYRESGALGVDGGRGVDVTGYSVEAVDGGIGKVDEATYDVGSSYLVVDTGPWIFGKKVLHRRRRGSDRRRGGDRLRQPDEGPDQGLARVRRVELPGRRLQVRGRQLLRPRGRGYTDGDTARSEAGRRLTTCRRPADGPVVTAVDWDDFDFEPRSTSSREGVGGPDGEKMIWAFEQALGVARIDPGLLEYVLAAVVCLARPRRISRRERCSRRSVAAPSPTASGASATSTSSRPRSSRSWTSSRRGTMIEGWDKRLRHAVFASRRRPGSCWSASS